MKVHASAIIACTRSTRAGSRGTLCGLMTHDRRVERDRGRGGERQQAQETASGDRGIACHKAAQPIIATSAAAVPMNSTNEAVPETIAAERCTAVYGVPTMFIAEMDHPNFAEFDLSSLRTGIMAGSPCPIEVMRKAVERMHLSEIVIGYGMTETSPVSFISATDDPLERRVSTVGRAMPYVEAKVVDAEGRIVPRGTPGELLTRGYLVMLGYWDDEEKTREAIDPARWMKTGDLATIDEEGYCNIVGRIKDMVIRGGENVYPREIEEFLYRHPKIQDVQVIGVPDRHYGEELCAWVRLRDGENATAEEIREFCRGQIAHYKIPRYVRFVDGFPMTVAPDGCVARRIEIVHTIENVEVDIPAAPVRRRFARDAAQQRR